MTHLPADSSPGAAGTAASTVANKVTSTAANSTDGQPRKIPAIVISALVAAISWVLLVIGGPDGSMFWQFTPLVATALVGVFVLAMALFPIFLVRDIYRWLSSPSRHRVPSDRHRVPSDRHIAPSGRRLASVVFVGISAVGLVLWYAALAINGLIWALDAGGDFAPLTYRGTQYYERDRGFVSPNYTYYEALSPFTMRRSGMETGETRLIPDGVHPSEPLTPHPEDVSSGILPPEPVAPSPQDDSSPAPGTERPGENPEPVPSTPSTPSAPSPPATYMDRETLLRVYFWGSPGGVWTALGFRSPVPEGLSGSVGETMYGLMAVNGFALGQQARFVAGVSTNNGLTWQERGLVVESGSGYSYFVIDENIQIAGFGSQGDEDVPPILMTRDGGWTWEPLVLPVPMRTQPSAQFLVDASRDGGALSVTLNFPSWVTDPGPGVTYISDDDGVTWQLAPQG